MTTLRLIENAAGRAGAGHRLARNAQLLADKWGESVTHDDRPDCWLSDALPLCGSELQTRPTYRPAVTRRALNGGQHHA